MLWGYYVYMCNKDFVHLHAHTHFSVQDALPSPTKYATKAREMGFRAAAITDHGKMGGAVEFVSGCRNQIEGLDPIKPIIGIEVYTCEDRFDKSKTEDGRRRKLNHLTLLAQNDVGYKNLLALSALGNDPNAFHYSPRIDWGCIEKHSEGVIALSGCLASEVNQSLIKGDIESAERTCEKYKNLFDDRYFVELQYHGIDEQKNNMKHLIHLSNKFGVPIVASNDVHYLDKLDYKVHDVLIQMRDQRDSKNGGEKKNGKLDAYSTHQFFLKSHEEMMKIFGKNAPDAIKNSVLISEMVDDFLKLDIPHLLPKSIIPEFDNDFNEFRKKNLPYNKVNEAYLAYRAFNGLKNLGFSNNKEYKSRLLSELKQIWYMGVTDYFLIQNEMVEFMKSNDIMYGIRGSGVGSLVNYCLSVSSVDPIRWNLMFERFLNPGRGNQYKIDISEYPAKQWLAENGYIEQIPYSKELLKKCKEWLAYEDNYGYLQYEPDIMKEIWVLENQGLSAYIVDLARMGIKTNKNDCNLWTAYILGITSKKPQGEMVLSRVATLPDVDTDIDSLRRSEVIDWAVNRFGKDNVAQIGTWGTYGAKASVVGCLKTSDRFINQYGDNVHQMALRVSATIPSTPGMTIDTALQESPDFVYHYKQWKEEIDIANKLQGTISNFGVHAAGVLISSLPISASAPLENSKGNLCSGYDMSNVERVGLVKYDYLGLNTLTMINMTMKRIKDRYGDNIKPFSLEDERIYKNIYAKGKTGSVFQFASKGMQDALKKINASNMEDLITVVALYRPGPLEYIDVYAENKKNPEKVHYAHPVIKQHLEVTYGIIVYQEQGMRIVRDLAGFDHSEVDKLRKAISKKNDKLFNEVCSLFRKKCAIRNVSENVVEEFLTLLSKFVGYAFNRAHACSYAVLSFQTAWLRYYYPSEWLATCIQLAKDDEDKLSLYMKDCSMENIKVFSPSINHSSIDTVVDEYGNIHLPLTILKGVGDKVAEVCGYQPFADLTDFAYRAKPNRTIVKGLAMGNALDCLYNGLKFENIEEFLEYWDEIVAKKNAEEKQRLKDEKRMSMADSPIEIVKSEAPPVRTRTTRSVTKRITGLSKNLLDDDFFN